MDGRHILEQTRAKIQSRDENAKPREVAEEPLAKKGENSMSPGAHLVSVSF